MCEKIIYRPKNVIYVSDEENEEVYQNDNDENDNNDNNDDNDEYGMHFGPIVYYKDKGFACDLDLEYDTWVNLYGEDLICGCSKMCCMTIFGSDNPKIYLMDEAIKNMHFIKIK